MPFPPPHFMLVEGIRIAYYEQNPHSEHTICFIHGNSASSVAWSKQFASPLLAHYRLIAFDLPAHGQSSVSPDPANDYMLKGLGCIMAKTVQAFLPKDNYILSGVSLGTNIIAEMLACGINPRGLVLAGSCIIGGDYTLDKVFLPGIDTAFLFQDFPPAETVEKGYKAVLATTDTDDLQQIIKDYFSVQAPFRSSLLQSITNGVYSNEPEMVLQSGLPVLLVFGKDEKAVNPDYLDNTPFPVWKERVIKLPGGHFVQLDDPDTFNDYLLAYAQDAFSGFNAK